VELSVPSLRWSSLAPDGKHVVVAHARYVPREPNGGAWTRERAEAFGDVVTRIISRSLPGFAERVTHRAVLTPADLETRFGATDGAMTHGELTLDQILFMRPVPGWGRHAMPVHGLYLGGWGAHPGPGVIGGAGLLAARAALASRTRTS
jgi:phytoene dehydrogenase-like protein